MQDYNWREEREKFRPDFMKQPETGAGPTVRPPKKSRLVAVIVAVLAAAAIAGAVVWYRI